MNSGLTSSSGSQRGLSDHDKSFSAQASMTGSKSHHTGKDDNKAGDRVLRHPVFAMLHQWLNAIALTRSRLTVHIPASLEERTFDITEHHSHSLTHSNIYRYFLRRPQRDTRGERHVAKPKVIKALGSIFVFA